VIILKIKKYFIKFIIILFAITLFIYALNNKIINYNDIVINNNKLISKDLLFNHIGYKPDSSIFYTSKQIKIFYNKINKLNGIGVIDKIKISYSLPNKINVFIKERTPKYIIKSSMNDFILDNNGKIYSNIISDNPKTPIVKLNFYDKRTIHDWSYNGIKIKSLINSIKNNKLHKKYLLNTFKILDWLTTKKLYTKIQNVSIRENTININFKNMEIIFNKETDLIQEEFNLFDKMMTNTKVLKSLNINDIYELKEINLCFDNQIIVKT